MKNGIFYLNNTGSRWVSFENGKKPKIYALHNGKIIMRTALYFEQFGNFAVVCISVKGKKIKLCTYALTIDDAHELPEFSDVKRFFS